MSSKKKPRPQFEVPADIESGGESGWVYRSGTHAANSGHVHAEEPREERVRRPSRARAEETRTEGSATVVDSGTAAFFMGFAAIAQAVALGMTIAVLPFTMGMRAFRFFRSE
jgi:hypothetical protein